MCLSNIYVKKGEEQELLFKNAASIRVENGHIEVMDIMGRVTDFKGEIESVDLMENIIYIRQ